LGMAFLLLISLVVSAGLSFVGDFLNYFPESWEYASYALNFVVSFAVITLLFGMMFKLLPDVKMAWQDVWLGAAITSLLFSIGKVGIGLYLGQSTMASSYGVAGSFVVLLVWVYYSSLILFFGAELTKVYADNYGSRILPAKNAIPIPETPAVSATSGLGGRPAEAR
ncbi:MAG TPA: YihY/virulence factor BrkB family protein, partial [Pirellulales bacterium]